jgi:hypothetical protein
MSSGIKAWIMLQLPMNCFLFIYFCFLSSNPTLGQLDLSDMETEETVVEVEAGLSSIQLTFFKTLLLNTVFHHFALPPLILSYLLRKDEDDESDSKKYQYSLSTIKV